MTADRDCIAEMDALIEAATQGSDWIPAVVASKILASADPAMLNGWLHAMAPEMLTAVITRRERSKRQVARARAGSRAFADASSAASAAADKAVASAPPVGTAESAERREAEASIRKTAIRASLGSFEVTYAVDEKNNRRRVADMTGSDHQYVASDYEKDAKPLMLLAAFHKQVAKKVGKKRTSDVFSEAEYDRLYRSITHAPSRAVA